MERILSLSGGKDSMYIAYHMQNTYDRIVYFDIGIEYPFVADLIEWAKCNINKPLEEIKPECSYDELYKKYGAPTRVARWCNSKLKMNCVKQYEEKYPNCIEVIGIAYNEPQRIKNGDNLSYPLFENKITEQMIIDNLPNEPYFSLYNGWYDNFTRLGCIKCPMATRKELAYIYSNYPDEFCQIWQERIETELKFDFKFYGKHDADYIFNLVLYEIDHPEHNQRKKSDREQFETWLNEKR